MDVIDDTLTALADEAQLGLLGWQPEVIDDDAPLAAPAVAVHTVPVPKAEVAEPQGSAAEPVGTFASEGQHPARGPVQVAAVAEPEFAVTRASSLTEQQVELFGAGQLQDDSLAARFVVPPFSVLDARQGYWTKRKREWMALGIRGEEGRGDDLVYSHSMEKYRPTMTAQSSVFDPVLCELVYRWFTPGPCHVLDPFAGEATKGLVACKLGHRYTGVELRPEQVAANQRQAAAMGVAPNWLVGDSAKLADILPPLEGYDLLFTSPPYYDLEVYQGGAADGSTFGTYEQFMAWYASIFKQATDRLRTGFCVVKVGEVRDKKTGAYRDFVGDNVRIFRQLGLHYYNTAVLVTAVGSLPVRVTRHFSSNRKLGMGHQNVLVFYKGDLDTIGGRFPKEIQYGYEWPAVEEVGDGGA